MHDKKFILYAVCRNPACAGRETPLPDRLNPRGPFDSFNDAESFIDALKAPEPPRHPNQPEQSERLRRHLEELRASMTEWPPLVTCKHCGAVAKAPDYDFIIKTAAEEG